MLAKWKALFGPSAAASSAKVAIVPPAIPERSAIASDAEQQKLKAGDFGYRCQVVHIQMCSSAPAYSAEPCLVFCGVYSRLA